MTLTGEILISYFETSVEKSQKIYFQTDKDESNAKRIVNFFASKGGEETCKAAIDRFVSREKQPVIFLHDFVVKLGSIVEEINLENKDRDEFRRLVQETKTRMDGDSN
jgi:hypothetical protein